MIYLISVHWTVAMRYIDLSLDLDIHNTRLPNLGNITKQKKNIRSYLNEHNTFLNFLVEVRFLEFQYSAWFLLLGIRDLSILSSGASRPNLLLIHPVLE